MNEMVERVARAIWERHVGGYPWAALSEGSKVYWVDVARDAIAAMREPTDAMVDDAEDAWMWRYSPRNIWRAMIDEALR